MKACSSKLKFARVASGSELNQVSAIPVKSKPNMLHRSLPATPEACAYRVNLRSHLFAPSSLVPSKVGGLTPSGTHG